MTTPDKQTFRDAMACVGAAVNIITTDGPAGMAGFTASAVCSAGASGGFGQHDMSRPLRARGLKRVVRS